MPKKTILIIEDDRVLLSVIEELLVLEDLNVLVARNAATGIQLLTETQPDLILCDINMPHGSGYMVHEALQADKHAKTIPFLFMTAEFNFDEIQQKTSVRREMIISKPFDIANFLKTLHQWL